MAEIILTVTLILTISFASLLMIRRFFDPPFIYLGISFYIFGLSALAMSFGLQTEFEDKFVLYKDYYVMLEGLIFSIFILGVVTGFHVLKSKNGLEKIFPRINKVRSDTVYITGIVCLLALSSIITVIPLVNTGGNIFATIYEIRFGDAIENFKFSQISIRFYQLFSIAFLLDLMIRKKYEKQSFAKYSLAWALVLISIFQGLLMGGKNFVIYPLLIFMIGLLVCVYNKGFKAFILPALLILILLPGLQYVRVHYVFESNRSTEDLLKDSLGTDLLDSNILYLETESRADITSTGEDFYTGLVGIVPRALWPDKPQQITVGGKFKDFVSEGRGEGAWPVFGLNQWYVNFGWPGVLFGGFLTGLILRLITNRYNDFRSNPYSLSFMIFLTILMVVPGGIDNLFLMRYILYVLPIFIFAYLINPRLYLPEEYLKSYSR